MSNIEICKRCGIVKPCPCERRITQRRADDIDELWNTLMEGLRGLQGMVNSQVEARLWNTFMMGALTMFAALAMPFLICFALLYEEPEIKIVDAIFAAFQ